MSTHNICFSGEIRKIFSLILLLSGAMIYKTKKYSPSLKNKESSTQLIMSTGHKVIWATLKKDIFWEQ